MYVAIFHEQFHIEPAEPPVDDIYFADDQEAEDGLSVFPTHAAVGTPVRTAACSISVVFAEEPPPLGDAVRAVAFPLRVDTDDGLFVRTVGQEPDMDNRLSIPKGDHVLMVRFFPASPNPNEEELPPDYRVWDVVITVLPIGAMATGVL